MTNHLLHPQADSFPIVYPGEKHTLAFAIGVTPPLAAGETLSTPTVERVLKLGGSGLPDVANNEVLSGTNDDFVGTPTVGNVTLEDGTVVQGVLVVVTPTVNDIVYGFEIKCTTSNANKILYGYGKLNVKRPF